MRYAGDMPLGKTHEQTLDAHTRDLFQTLRTGEYIDTIPMRTDSTAHAIVAATLRASRVFNVPRKMTVDRIAIRVAVAGAALTKARLGIYRDGVNLYPGALVLDAGEVAVDSTGLKEIVISQQLDKGLYWLAVISDGAPQFTTYQQYLGSILGLTMTESVNAEQLGWSVAQAYGALPDPFTAGGVIATQWGARYNMHLRLLSLD